MAIKAAETSPNRALYVGDKLAVDCVGARKAGLHAVLVDRENVFPDAKCIRARDLNFFKRYF
jgi:FMN phosphatase YigB (HAD superfamily)